MKWKPFKKRCKGPKGGMEVVVMPIYEYQCDVCGRKMEFFSRGDTPIPMAIVCRNGCKMNGATAKKIVSLPAPAQFTGTGFYATDYCGAGSKKND